MLENTFRIRCFKFIDKNRWIRTWISNKQLIFGNLFSLSLSCWNKSVWYMMPQRFRLLLLLLLLATQHYSLSLWFIFIIFCLFTITNIFSPRLPRRLSSSSSSSCSLRIQRVIEWIPWNRFDTLYREKC